MKAKRLIALAIAFVLFTGICTGCQKRPASQNADIPTVTVWASGSEIVRDMMQALANGFNSDPYYSTKAFIEIQFILSGTSETSITDRLAAAKESGQTDTDFEVIETRDDALALWDGRLGTDFFIDLDPEIIKNWDNVLVSSGIGGNRLVPYRTCDVYLAYNADVVTDPPTTFDELYQWIQDNPGRFAYNAPSTGGAGLSFTMSVLYNYLPKEAATSVDEVWKDQWGAGFEQLAKIHPNLYKSAGKVQYPTKNQGTIDLLANREIDMCPAYVDMILMQQNAGTLPDNIKLIQTTPSFAGQVVGFAVPAIGKDKEAAQYFIDYSLTPAAQKLCWETINGFPVIDLSMISDAKDLDMISGFDTDNLRNLSIGMLTYEFLAAWESNIGTLE